MKKISVSLSAKSIDLAIKTLQNYHKFIERKSKEFLQELAKEGFQAASVQFSKAVYDGTNDVSVSIEERGENSVAVVAVGNATLFIEFGTGINFPENHPEAGSISKPTVHGMYGYHLGSLPNGWRYKGDPGTNGEVITSGKYQGYVKTIGNPANACMYLSKKEIEQKFSEIAKRVFQND